MRVIATRADGFHSIESILVRIPFYDVMEFETSKVFSLKTYGFPLGIESKNNLLYKTWQLLTEVYQIPPLTIQLLKNIPPQSGLGGGSSNAAFLIKRVNNLLELGLGIEEMKQLALTIGSDCPFFIENAPALVTGRGEHLQTLTFSLKGLYLVLLSPGFGVSTRVAYSLVKPKPAEPLLEIVSQPIESWKGNLVNDFEQPLFKKYSQLKKLKDELYTSGAVYASMSGSGSTIFGIFKNQPELPAELTKFVHWSGVL